MSEGSPKVEKKEKPKKEKKEKKDGALFKAKKNLAGKAATSGLGKSVLNKLLDDNSNQIIKSMKRIITIHSDKKKATEIHDTIIKILIKAHFQIEKKNVDPAEFALALPPLLRVFRRLSKLAKKDYTPEVQNERFKKVEGTLKKVGKIIGVNLGPHLTQKNKGRLTECLNFLANAEFLKKAWTDPKSKEQRDKLVVAVDKFLADQDKAQRAAEAAEGK